MQKNTTSAPSATPAAAGADSAEPVVPLVIGVTCVAVLFVALIAFPRRPSTPGTDDGAAAVQAARADESATAAPHAASAPSKKSRAPKMAKNRFAESSRPSAPIAAVRPAADVPFTESAVPKLVARVESSGAAASAVPTVTGDTSPITITGCLEVSVDHDEFRLTDTDGVDAPKSRNWRTGFLKKQTAAVGLVEPSSRLALQTHVGRRVTATGLLSGHDLKVSALRAVGPPCN
jgi:hypothetical protein